MNPTYNADMCGERKNRKGKAVYEHREQPRKEKRTRERDVRTHAGHAVKKTDKVI